MQTNMSKLIVFLAWFKKTTTPFQLHLFYSSSYFNKFTYIDNTIFINFVIFLLFVSMFSDFRIIYNLTNKLNGALFLFVGGFYYIYFISKFDAPP